MDLTRTYFPAWSSAVVAVSKMAAPKLGRSIPGIVSNVNEGERTGGGLGAAGSVSPSKRVMEIAGRESRAVGPPGP